jgi:hypothetical protein
MSHHVRTFASGKWQLLAGALLCAMAVPGRADEPKTDSSLKLIPADAAYYGAMLRNREQVEAVAKSKTWAKIAKLPAYQKAHAYLQQMWTGGNFAEFRGLLEQKENRELVDLLVDAVSEEIFCYGAANWVDFVDLFKQINNAYQYAPLTALIKSGGDQKALQSAQGRGVLRVLARNPQKIRVPDFIVGFKIKDAKKAEAQIKRLEDVLNGLIAMVPQLEGHLKRGKVGEDSFLTLHLDGGMVPWDEIPWNEVEEAAGEFDGVKKSLKQLKMTISVGARNGYLLFAIGSSTEGLKQLGGEGQRLTGRPELKPLVAAAGKRLTSMGYTSKALASKGGMSAEDIDSMTVMAGHALDAAGIPEDKRQAIAKDVANLGNELKKSLPVPGASVSFSYLTERGYEGYDYAHGTHPDVDGSKPLSLLDHVGSDPILAVVGRSKGTQERYDAISKWAKVAYGHAEPLILEKLDAQQKQKYQEVSKLVFPLLKRFDEITGQKLLPALADGQAGLVIDGKTKSKQWHQAMPPSDQALPILELGFLVGISDRDLLETAMKAYAKLFEDALTKIKEVAPPNNAPPFSKVPDPEVKSASGGKLYLWKLPEQLKLDPQLLVAAGLSEKVGVLCLTSSHAERLLTAKPLKVEGGPLADTKRPLASAAYFNFPALIDTLTPWVIYTVEKSGLERALGVGGDEEKTKQTRAEIVKQVRTLLDALKAIRGSASATYFEGGVLVTHSEIVIRDE